MNVLVDHGKWTKPWANGPTVRAVDIEIIRGEFYRSHPAPEGTDAVSKAAARRKAFGRAINEAKAGNLIGSWETEGITYVWLIDPAPQSTQDEMPVARAVVPPSRAPVGKGFRVTGDCPDGTICLQCHETVGVKRIADNRAVGGKSETLHEHCAEAWFTRLNTEKLDHNHPDDA
jgi:hypothetical protein